MNLKLKSVQAEMPWVQSMMQIGLRGVDHFEMTDLVKGIAKRGDILGIDFCEVVPALDVRDLTSIFGARLILNFIGAMAHSGQIGMENHRPKQLPDEVEEKIGTILKGAAKDRARRDSS
jgi:hypothetical protein